MLIKKFLEPKRFISIKSSRLLISSPGKAGLIILLDVLFVVSAFALYVLFGYFGKLFFVPKYAAANAGSVLIYIFLMLIYFLALLFSYSFFKYCVLDSIKSLFGKIDFSFGRLGQFYLLNLMISSVFLAVMLLLGFVLDSVKQAYAPLVFIFLAVPYLLIFYVSANLSQSLFYQGASIKKAIWEGFGITFTKIRNYRETILVIILSALLLWLLLLGSGYLIRLAAGRNYALYISLYKYFKEVSKASFDLLFYLAILINRVSFYLIVSYKTKRASEGN